MGTMEFGDIVRELRSELGLTQKQLAAQIGTSKTTISLYESHERMPTPKTLIGLSSIFHVSIDYLLGMDRTKWVDVSGLSDKDVRLVCELVESLREKGQ